MKLKHKKNNVPMVVRIGPVGEIREGTSIGKIQKIERKNAKQTIKYSKKSSCIQH